PDTTAVRKLLSSADAVLVSEPSALSDTPDAQSLLAAQTVRSIMGALAPAPAVLIPIAPAWVQWIIVLDVLLLFLLALQWKGSGLSFKSVIGEGFVRGKQMLKEAPCYGIL
ncbi:hypothetical protein DK853_29710, partial [Klebsiella oxytoca]